MKAKDRKYIFDISGFGKRNRYYARTLNNAVSQFRREFQLLLKTDPETGGWKGISYDVIGKAN
jgi:hypothetical protein